MFIAHFKNDCAFKKKSNKKSITNERFHIENISVLIKVLRGIKFFFFCINLTKFVYSEKNLMNDDHKFFL